MIISIFTYIYLHNIKRVIEYYYIIVPIQNIFIPLKDLVDGIDVRERLLDSIDYSDINIEMDKVNINIEYTVDIKIKDIKIFKDD